MDILSDVLDVLKFSGSLYFTTEFTGRWGIKVPAYSNVARFHFASEGRFFVRVGDQSEYLAIEEGDFLIIPHGASHEMKDQPETPAIPLDDDSTAEQDTAYTLKLGDNSTPAMIRMVCGHFEFDAEFRHPLVDQLPDYIIIRKAQSEAYPWFQQAVLTMTSEAAENRLGFAEVLKRVSEILFIQTVRMWHQGGDNATPSFVSAVQDNRISRSLNAFHAAADEAWTVERLAREAGMSRTVFTETFTRLTGFTPISYVTMWRMQKAQRLLAQDSSSVDGVARAVGYDSAPAFSRTFKRHTGESPGAFRRRHRDQRSAADQDKISA